MTIAPAPLNETPELPRFSLRSLFILVALASVPLAAIGYLYRTETARRAEIARLDELDEKTRAALVREVDAISLKLGRAPKNQDELERHLGKPLPKVHDGKYPTQVYYQSTGKNSYVLCHLDWFGPKDDLVYDSSIPNAGWVPHFD